MLIKNVYIFVTYGRPSRNHRLRIHIYKYILIENVHAFHLIVLYYFIKKQSWCS